MNLADLLLWTFGISSQSGILLALIVLIFFMLALFLMRAPLSVSLFMSVPITFLISLLYPSFYFLFVLSLIANGGVVGIAIWNLLNR